MHLSLISLQRPIAHLPLTKAQTVLNLRTKFDLNNKAMPNYFYIASLAFASFRLIRVFKFET